MSKSESENGTLRYSWTWDQVNVGGIQFDSLNSTVDGTIYPLDFEITSDNLLVHKGFPWSFCNEDTDVMKRDNHNLGGLLLLEKDPGCPRLEGVNVIRRD